MILLTGATGFIGSAIYKECLFRGFFVRPVVRSTNKNFYNSSFLIENLNSNVDWGPALDGIETIIHCAAQAHGNNNSSSLYEVNFHATVALARKAAIKGVKRFIYISTIGVNGNQTFDNPFLPDDDFNPRDEYSISKCKAEQGLAEISEKTGLELVIVRPPLVYGPNAPGNFGRLVSAIRSGKYLPFGAVNNKRTLVALDNLVSLIVTCIYHPHAKGEIFLAGDSEDISTTDLLRRIGDSIRKPAKLIPIPVDLMRVSARIFGKTELFEKICGNLQLDISKNRELLGWEPPISLDEGFRRLGLELI